jgi:hypothetical protein
LATTNLQACIGTSVHQIYWSPSLGIFFFEWFGFLIIQYYIWLEFQFRQQMNDPWEPTSPKVITIIVRSAPTMP